MYMHTYIRYRSQVTSHSRGLHSQASQLGLAGPRTRPRGGKLTRAHFELATMIKFMSLLPDPASQHFHRTLIRVETRRDEIYFVVLQRLPGIIFIHRLELPQFSRYYHRRPLTISSSHIAVNTSTNYSNNYNYT